VTRWWLLGIERGEGFDGFVGPGQRCARGVFTGGDRQQPGRMMFAGVGIKVRSRPDHAAVARGCSTAAGVLLVGLAGFEALLAAGVAWGRAAWGGGNAELNPGLRIGSAVVAGFFVGAALVVRRQGGHGTWAPLPDRWLRPATWGLAAYTGFGTIPNMLSRSPSSGP
jgi:hypothetical protein